MQTFSKFFACGRHFYLSNFSSSTQFRAEEVNTNMMRFNSVDSFTDTVCSHYTNSSTVNGSENGKLHGIVAKMKKSFM